MARLQDGALDAGDHRFEISGVLAPGLYVITTRTTTPGGATATDAVRWTRMR